MGGRQSRQVERGTWSRSGWVGIVLTVGRGIPREGSITALSIVHTEVETEAGSGPMCTAGYSIWESYHISTRGYIT